MTLNILRDSAGSKFVYRECSACGNDSLFQLCDVENCENVATCGQPSPSGYRWLCGVHFVRSKGVTDDA